MEFTRSESKALGLSGEIDNFIGYLPSKASHLISSSNSTADALRVVGQNNDIGLRETLQEIGIAGAVISYTSATLAMKHGYLVGFDQLRTDPVRTGNLLSYASLIWQNRSEDFNADALADKAVFTGENAIEASRALLACHSELSLRFGYFAVVQVPGIGGATLRALLFRTRDDGPFTAEIQRNFKLTLPLIIHIAETEMQTAAESRHMERLETLLDRVSLAIFMLDGQGKPHYCNAAARAMLLDKTMMRLSPEGTVRGATLATTRSLQEAIKAAVASGEDRTEIAVRLEGPDGWLLGFVVTASHSLDGSRSAMLLVNPQRSGDASGAMLEALGLLRSEQRFLTQFLEAKSLSEAAQRSGLSDETAKTYLKRIRAKLGVHRQMELARLIYGLIPPLRADEKIAKSAN
ncbi:DNA-binding protein with HTH domain protein [Sphingomonas paucimobilis]|nr:DNA-binding protein with HTH domain protein [Sphingomonas paucimobilis]